MTHHSDISDETLTAYLDAALDDADMERVSQALAQDPALSARLDALSVPVGDLRSAFDTMLRDVPDDIVPVQPPQAQHSKLMLAAAACALLALGTVLGITVAKPKQTLAGNWQEYVAAYQALYVEDTLNVVDQTTAEKQAQLARVSSRLGRPLDAATDVPGFDFKRAQVLGYKGNPLVQMAYLTDDNVPMALCIIKSSDKDVLTTMRLEGLEAAGWSDGTFAYLLIGGDNPNQIEAAAKHLKARL